MFLFLFSSFLRYTQMPNVCYATCTERRRLDECTNLLSFNFVPQRMPFRQVVPDRASLRECSAGKVNLGARKYLTGKAALFNDLPVFLRSARTRNFVRLRRKTSMAPFPCDNGPGRRHSAREFHTSTLCRGTISPFSYVTLRARQKKNIPGSPGKLTRPLFRGESFRENGEKLTSCIRSKAASILQRTRSSSERMCSVLRGNSRAMLSSQTVDISSFGR